MSVANGNYTSTQIQQFGLDPNNTTEAQNGYRLENDGRGGRNLTYVGNGGGGSSGGGGGGGGFDYNAALQRALDLTKQNNAPVVASLQASQKPLEDRYNNLIASLKANQTTAENRQTQVTAGELAKRGITNDSTMFGQEITNAVNPITSSYTGQIKDTGAAENQDIADLATKIAQLQSGDIGAATGIAGAQQSGYQFGQNYDLQQQQLAQSKAQQEATNNLAAQQLAATIAQQRIQDAISQGQLGISGGNLALNQQQFNFNRQLQNPNDPVYGANAWLQQQFNNSGQQGPVAPRYSIVK